MGLSVSGGYRLTRLLDEGGAGLVYEANDPAGRRVALKILRPEVVTERTLSRLSREASVTSRIDNKHIVPILDAGHDLERDLAYLVTPLLEGTDVAALLERVGPLAPEVAVRIALQVADGLSAVHTAGIVYRDVRPSRIFLQELSGGAVRARVFGFGLSRGNDPAAGSGASWSGERARGARAEGHASSQSRAAASGPGERPDPRIDVFGLAASLYEMLCGVPPWAELDVTPDTEDCGPDDVPESQARPEPERPSIQDRAPWVEAPLATALAHALSGDIDRRHPSIEAFADALRSIAGDEERVRADMLGPLDPEVKEHIAERAEATSDPLIGRELGGRYAVRRLIGRGGMGAVYEAEGPDGRRIAAKVIFRGMAGQDDQATRRFIREARAVTTIQSPHVVRTFELGTDITLGAPFIVMELLTGVDLAKLLRQRGPLEPAPLVRVFLQAAQGLAAAHAEGIIHRDIKPANLFLHLPPEGPPLSIPPSRGSGLILLQQGDRPITVKVCDFGIAKRTDDGAANDLTRAGGVLGSPIYMSPEQAKRARDVDRRSDIWSLCISMYQALCGSCPWDPNASLAELLVAICTERVPPLLEAAPWVDPDLAAIVHRGLARDPAERWQSMADLCAALERHAGGEAVTLSDLRGVDAERRARATPMAKLRSAKAGRSAGDATGSTADGSAVSASDAPAALGVQRRLAGAIAAAALAAAIVGAVVLRGSGSAGPAAPAAALPGTSAAAQQVAEEAALPPAAPELAAHTAVVEIPPGATARVNGEVRAVEGGRLELSGRAGDVFQIEVARGDDNRRDVRVIMTSEGKAEPARIELAAALPAATTATATPGRSRPGAKRPGAQAAAGGAAAPAPAQTPAATSTAVKPVDTW